ncbi:MAG: HAD-IC family P-type ATPase [Clostridia bacterium]
MRKKQGKIGNTIPKIIINHVFTPFNAFNFAIAVCIAAVGAYENLLYLFVVLANIAIGVIQDIRSKHIVEQLSLITAPHVTIICDDGSDIKITPEELECGNLMRLARGDQVCADATVVDGIADINEALLTGEADPIKKFKGDALLSGSFVSGGSCVARAERVGENSYASSITAKARQPKKNRSMILDSLNKLVRFTSLFILPLGAILFYQSYVINGIGIELSVTTTSAALLGLLPKGLVLLTSVSLVLGVIRLGKRHTLVQQLFGIEALARVDVLCMDKTGTLTQGHMGVDSIIPLSPDGLSSAAEDMIRMLIWSFEDENNVLTALKQHFPCYIGESPVKLVSFSSERAWSGAQFSNVKTVLMGAPDKLLSQIPPDILRAQQDGRHIIVFGCSNEPLGDSLPASITPIAAISLYDTIRPEAGDTLRYFERQGVRLMILSGDNANATAAIARQAGMKDADAFVDATMLTSDQHISEAAGKYSVFGRVSPDQKQQIIKALQSAGHTVAMLGDGVNDVLAIRQADCGIAMAAGCDAGRRVARLVLMDNSFASLPNVVGEGRRVINNISRVAAFFLTKTCFSFLLSLLCALLNISYPFEPMQLSIYSIFCEALPALILTLLPNAARIEGDILKNAFKLALPYAILISAGTILITLFGGTIPLPFDTSWLVFAWTFLIGSLLVLRTVFMIRRTA